MKILSLLRALDSMSTLKKILFKFNNICESIDFVQIRIASPKRIKSWPNIRLLPTGKILKGEVLSAETINYYDKKPISGGLFCQKIFGPIKDWTCGCLKSKKYNRSKTCAKCQIEFTESRVRRYRMGIINLVIPMSHIWYFKGNPSYLKIILGCYDRPILTKNKLKSFKDDSSFPKKINQFLSNIKYSNKENNLLELDEILDIIYCKGSYKIDISHPFYQLIQKNKQNNTYNKPFKINSDILKTALENIDINYEISKFRSTIIDKVAATAFSINKISFLLKNKDLFQRVRILESFKVSRTKISWMILTVLPILPPTLRPILELENGNLVASDLNEFYRQIIYGVKTLIDVQNISYPLEAIATQSLQLEVDRLIDNARVAVPKSLNNKVLKSLSQILEGKEGRFRLNLLGKRVDYSGRSVITVGPTLSLGQCGLPYQMAKELFKPFIINELLRMNILNSDIKIANLIIERNKPYLWLILNKLATKHCVLLNRAPTLHRFGIQAFSPVITPKQTIEVHPLLCTGFNADFDGDQMAVHLPLTNLTQLEASRLMKPYFGILSQSNGSSILKPTQDMVIGTYYLTLMINKSNFLSQICFFNEEEALKCYYKKKITIHSPILVRYLLSEFTIKVFSDKLKILDQSYLSLQNEHIKIYKELESKNNKLKIHYFITSIGVLVGRKKIKSYYKISDLFLETTPGRILFNSNITNLLTNSLKD